VPTPPLARRDLLTLAGILPLSSLAVSATGPAGGSLAPEQMPPNGDRTPAGRRTALYALLGDLPERRRPIGATKRGEQDRDGYLLETWDLDLNGFETVPAYVARPRAVSGRVPAVVFNHSHGGGYGIGKTEFIEGREYLQPVPYAKVLTDLGYVAISIDHWVFGERARLSELDTFKMMIWQGRVLWGMMVYDSLRAIDWLVTRHDVDPSRVATLGMSMGSTMAQWLAALDERVKVTVDICCLTDYHTLLAKAGLSSHGIYYFVPSLLKHFTASQINALIAPRAHLSIAGLQDRLAPVEGLDIIDRELTRVYGELEQSDRWKLVRYDVGHVETPEGRAEAIGFLKRHL
jgi:hypothetical protein